MKKIVLAGGSGQLGELLVRAFAKKDIHCVILTRQSTPTTDPAICYVYWDGAHIGDWKEHLEDADVLINLSGKSIQCRFNKENKRQLASSRIIPTKLLGQALQGLKNPPRLWINFSGISIFGGQDGIHDESSLDYGDDYLASLTKVWEQTFREVVAQTHKVILRVSPVLMNDSGMFASLKPIVKWGLGGQVANGKQYVSWIHKRDFVKLVLWIIKQEAPAPIYHACSPYPVSNALFMKAFRQNLNQPIGLPLPTIMAKVGSIVKGVDSSLLLQSVAASAKVSVDEGFIFKYPYIQQAIQQLLKST